MLLIIVGVGLIFFRKESSPQPSTPAPTGVTHPTPTIKQTDVSLTVEAGEDFSIVLWGNPYKGYQWKFGYDPNYIVTVGERIEPVEGDTSKPSKGTYIFSSLKPGKTMITALYLKPLDVAVPPEEIKIYQVKITSSTD